MNKPEIFSFVTEENIKLNVNLHRAKNNRKNITILYFHGGGLLYGVRDDLPEIYINNFLNAGYDFLALDYPLAPESKLDMILKSAFEMLFFYLKNLDKVFKLKNNKYVLFGRSAGAYLSFMMCDMLIKNQALMPMAIISLYGYARLDEVQFNTPNKYYNKLASVPDESIEKIISDSPVTYGPMNLRFSLYIKARQEGTWIKHLCGKEDPTKYSLDDEKLKAFPPTILVAATLDPDVPYRMTKTLRKLIPNSHLITIYREAHDFDRDVNDESGRLTYEEIIKWLEDKI
ncbi:alpha/beta hydrolase [Pelosinus sp. IPA-1]|uniref:alpha/beta hydrolase n=1 Tax=Pelosinus sp. IPA-1 TaxID=3029569 RepID=UPI0024362367|nr:alpha/beta hydrolase [Pelosinus sp. IPA-1]GMA98894.1 alpha/beta hydrolase [Pelosinus sp. IPA-1]